MRNLKILILVTLSFYLITTSIVIAQRPIFKFGSDVVQYHIVVVGTPTNKTTLTTGTGFINVTGPSSDCMPPESQQWVMLDTSAIAPGLMKNIINSAIFKNGSNESIETKTANLEGFVLRGNTKGQFILGVLTKDNADVLITRRIATILNMTGDTIRDQNGYVDLARLNSELMSLAKWQYKSATDATLSENEAGILMLHGKVEFLLAGAGLEGLAGSNMKNTSKASSKIEIGPDGQLKTVGEAQFTISELVYSRGMVYLNFGEGTTLRIQNLRSPVELIDGNGKITMVSVLAEGTWRFIGSKWQLQTKN